jgi:hypothetical protein
VPDPPPTPARPLRRALVALLALGAVGLTVSALATALGGEGAPGVNPRYPRGADFLGFWAGGLMLDEGRADQLYDVARFRRRQQQVFSGHRGHRPLYPPPLYQLCAPLAGVPFPTAVAVHLLWMPWLVLLAAWALARGSPLPVADRRLATVALAVGPIGYLGVLTGQFAGLWLLLFGLGVLLLSRDRPVAGGLVLGLLCAKPTLGLALVAWLVATRQWRTLGGFVTGGALLLAVSLAAGGATAWLGWLELMTGGSLSGGQYWDVPERDLTMRSLVGWRFRKTPAAGAVSIVTMAAAWVLVAELAWTTWRAPAGSTARGLGTFATLSACLFALPHLLGYDSGLHAPAFLASVARVRSGEARLPRLGTGLLVAAFIAPALSPLSKQITFGLGALIVLLWILWMRNEVRGASRSPVEERPRGG